MTDVPEEVAVLGLVQAVRRVPAAVVIVGATGRVLHVNERAGELAARLRIDVPTMLFGPARAFQLDGQPYRSDAGAAVRSLSAGEEVLDDEYYLYVGEERVYLRVSSSPVRDAAGAIVVAAVLAQDVTAEKRVNGERAFERAAAEERLRDVRKVERQRIARAMHDESMRELAYALTLAQSPAPESATLVPVLERVGQQLRAAIYDLRLSDQEGRSFRGLLETLVAMQRTIKQGMSIDLDVELDLPGGPLGTPGTELLRILGEALTNARRHASAQRVRVHVRGSSRRICAEIADDGVGFDLEAAPAPAQQGMRGMRERAELLGGFVVFESEPGAGTTVRVEVPLQDGERGAAPVRVLLVEDHAAVREALAARFDNDGDFDVVGQASSLAEARHMLTGIDVAVLDLGLPDGSGADLIEELRRHSPHAQALVMSPSLERYEIAEAVSRGAAAVLSNAVHLDAVVESVRRLGAGETLMPLEEVIELLRCAGRRREREHKDRLALSRLTSREREVLQTLAEGLDSRTSAERLCITLRTQRNHVANIEAKLGVHSQLQALVLALRYDVVRVPRGATNPTDDGWPVTQSPLQSHAR